MRTFILASVAILALSGTAQAQSYSNNFDGENGGLTALNYNGFTGLTATGNVDLTRSGDYYPCAGATGSCVDLDGTTGPGRLTSSSSYNFGAGDKVSFSFDLAGNSRNASSDEFEFGFDFGSIVSLNDVMINFGKGASSFGDFDAMNTYALDYIDGTAGFANRSFSFTAGSAGSLKFFVGTTSADDVGPVLDNLRFNVTPAVPEPAAWAMMIGGFGLVGGAMRRRRAATPALA